MSCMEASVPEITYNHQSGSRKLSVPRLIAMSDRFLPSSYELVEAQAHVWNQVYMFINSMSLKCAIQLGIPDIIHKHGKPMTLSELTNVLPINKAKSHNITRLMRILIHSKLFVKVKTSDQEGSEEGYWLTPASRLLLTDEPLNQIMPSLIVLDPIFIDPLHHLAEWFQNDISTLTKTATGFELWETAGKDPRINELLNEIYTGDSRLVSAVLVDEWKQVFDGLKKMVDVGGGRGIMAKAITEACPGLECTVLDLPHVVAGLEGNKNVTFVGGDMFKSIPQADAVFLKTVLHDLSDEECHKLLLKCKEAIDPSKDKGGKVIIIDIILYDYTQEHEATETQLFFDMMMMAALNGKERTEKEWAKLFLDAGFTSYNITHALGVRSLIQVFP